MVHRYFTKLMICLWYDMLRSMMIRHRVSRHSNRTSIQEVFWYTDTISSILKLMNRDVHLISDSSGQLWRLVFSLELFAKGKESMGLFIMRYYSEVILIDIIMNFIRNSAGSGKCVLRKRLPHLWRKPCISRYHRRVEITVVWQLIILKIQSCLNIAERYYSTNRHLELCQDHSMRSQKLYERVMAQNQDVFELVDSMRSVVFLNRRIAASVEKGLVSPLRQKT